jgi:hypothetical protein
LDLWRTYCNGWNCIWQIWAKWKHQWDNLRSYFTHIRFPHAILSFFLFWLLRTELLFVHLLEHDNGGGTVFQVKLSVWVELLLLLVLKKHSWWNVVTFSVTCHTFCAAGISIEGRLWDHLGKDGFFRNSRSQVQESRN